MCYQSPQCSSLSPGGGAQQEEIVSTTIINSNNYYLYFQCLVNTEDNTDVNLLGDGQAGQFCSELEQKIISFRYFTLILKYGYLNPETMRGAILIQKSRVKTSNKKL